MSASAVLSLAPAAHAQSASGSAQMVPPDRWRGRAPEPEISAWDQHGLLGLEVQLRGFVAYAGGESPVQAPSLYSGKLGGNPTGTILNPGSCPAGQICTPYGIDPFAPGVALGWRFKPWMSVGAYFSYLTYNAQNGTDTGDAPDGTSQLARSQWVLGAYLRYYFSWLSRKLQPWVEAGVGFSTDQASYQRPSGQAMNGQPETGFYNLSEEGLAIPLSVGLDWRLAPIFSVGPMFNYTPVFGRYGCVDVEFDVQYSQPSKNMCGGPAIQSNVYGILSAGITAKVTLGPATR
jgi:hypothetical protein